MSQERKFARGLAGIGEAARLRESASLAVRESSQMAKVKSVEPIDYETFLVKSKNNIYNDPQRELVIFPVDDLVETVVPRKFRTSQCNVPDPDTLATNDGANLLAYESMRTYTRDWKVVSNKYRDYSGSYKQLPRPAKPVELVDHTFEIDQEEREEEPRNSSVITKKGWLNKGPVNRQDSIAFAFAKSFKKRYCCLKKQQDSTYILEIFKDEKQEDSKGPLFLDSAVDVIANSKKGRYAFEVRMQDQATVLFSADTEAEMQEWIKTLKQVIATDAQDGVSQRSFNLRGAEGDDSSLNGRDTDAQDGHGSSVPEILSYAKETPSTLSTKRKENRCNLFEVYSSLPRPVSAEELQTSLGCESPSEPFDAGVGSRLSLTIKVLKMKLQANIADDGKPEHISNPEPFFLTFALYDVKEGRRISENAYLDCNSPEIWAMLPPGSMPSNTSSRASSSAESNCAKSAVGDKWTSPPVQVVFAARKDFSDVYLVVFIDKVLQGSMSTAIEPYLKGADLKLGTRVHRQMRQYCSMIGHHRMPFAWAAKPLFVPGSTKSDLLGDLVVFKQEPNRLSEEDLIKRLQDLLRLDKATKWQQIPAEFGVKMDVLKPSHCLTNVLTSSLELVSTPACTATRSSSTSDVAPVSPQLAPTACTIEVDEFPARAADVVAPFSAFKNHFYVYPKNIKLDNLKNIKARNIACCVQLMEGDDDNATPAKCIYARPRSGASVFVSSVFCAVVHHSTNPDFYDEIKIRLPVHITEKHHLLFIFYHVSCEGSMKNAGKGVAANSATQPARYRTPSAAESVVGYSWLPLMKQKRIIDGEVCLPISSNLPSGYLVHDGSGATKSQGPDIRWHDGGKSLFKTALRLQSTIYTCNQHLTGFFQHCQKYVQPLFAPMLSDIESMNALKAIASDDTADGHRDCCIIVQSLLAVELGTVIQFLPTLLNQLFRLLTQTSNRDVAFNVVRVLVHIVQSVSLGGKSHLLHVYVKYVFDASYLYPQSQQQQQLQKARNIHEDLLSELSGLLRPNNSDTLVAAKFLRHSWFFLEVVIKSMTQYLLATGRIKMARTERFPATKDSNVVAQVEGFMQMVMPHIFAKHKDLPEECREANRSVAEFMKNLFTLIDRGHVFRLINTYMNYFSIGDSKALHECKFEFLRIVCSHEHYVQLNLPTLRAGSKDLKTESSLCEDYKKKHFLSGLLLQELKCALCEVPDIRRISINTFRDMIAKHALDDRYQGKTKIGRVIALYLPFLGILLENVSRLAPRESSRPQSIYGPASDNLDSISQVMAGDARSVSTRTSYRVSVADVQPAAVSGSVGPTPLGATPTVTTASVSPPTPGAGSSAGPPAKESVVLAAIAGHVALPSSPISASMSLRASGVIPSADGRSSPNDSVCSDDSSTTFDADKATSRTVAVQPQATMRFDKLESGEVKDLLLCFLFIVSHLPEEILIQWMSSVSESDLLNFFELLRLCLEHITYVGKKKLTSLRRDVNSSPSALCASNRKASTLPARRMETFQKQLKHMSVYGGGGDVRVDGGPSNAGGGGWPVVGAHLVRDSSTGSIDENLNDQVPQLAQQDGCLVTETGMVVLDVLSMFTMSFKAQIDANDGDNAIMARVFDLHLQFLQLNQSEHVLKHAFALIRLYITKFAYALFGISAAGAAAAVSRCGSLCLHLLRCCSARLPSLRVEACVTLYHLMKANYEFTKRRNFARVNLQLIVSLSQLVGDFSGLANERFRDSLATLNNYSLSDKSMQRTSFATDVKKLTKRLRNVLMAMAQLREHEHDIEMLVDLHYSLARSYVSSSPQLRQTWLETMAKRHVDSSNYTEAAHCYLHIAGLVAEYLKRKDVFPGGCTALSSLSPNIVEDEKDSLPIDDSGIDDTQYTEDTLVEVLEQATGELLRAERYEALGNLSRLLVPIYERRRDYESLAYHYHTMHTAYSRVIEAARTGRRLLGTYFRVAFYGQLFEDEDGKQYIYKEPKLTTLSEICDRLKAIYGEKYGATNVKLIQDSKKVNPAELDPQIAYCQVTYVVPYFDEDEKQQRETDFERNERVNRFIFHTPFTVSGRAHGAVHEQCRRNTILTTSHMFPYVKKRIPVIKLEEMDLSPVEVAVDEMRCKVAELESLVGGGSSSTIRPIDLVKLQLKLQGAVSPQVNAGPLVYAEAFLVGSAATTASSPAPASGPSTSSPRISVANRVNGSSSSAGRAATAAPSGGSVRGSVASSTKDRERSSVEALKQAFRDFARVCHWALELHGTIISSSQLDYHEVMKSNFQAMLDRLSSILGEKLLVADALAHDGSAIGLRPTVGLTYSPSVSSA